MAIAFLLLVSMLIDTALSATGNIIATFFSGFFSDSIIGITASTSSLIIFTMLFATLFKYLPNAKVSWSDTWVGGIITALFYTLGKLIIGYYLGSRDYGSSYGAAGSLVLVLVWVYFSALIIFLGAEFTQVYANKFGSGIEPEDGARLIED